MLKTEKILEIIMAEIQRDGAEAVPRVRVVIENGSFAVTVTKFLTRDSS